MSYLRYYRYCAKSNKYICSMHIDASKSLALTLAKKTRIYGTKDFPYIPVLRNEYFFGTISFYKSLKPIKKRFVAYRLEATKKLTKKRIKGK